MNDATEFHAKNVQLTVLKLSVICRKYFCVITNSEKSSERFKGREKYYLENGRPSYGGVEKPNKKNSSFVRISKSFERISLSFEQIEDSFERKSKSFEQIRFVRTN